MLEINADRGWEGSVLDIFSKLKGQNVVVESGATDDGDKRYSRGDAYLAIGKDLVSRAVFHQWELVAAFPSIEICYSIIVGEPNSSVNQ